MDLASYLLKPVQRMGKYALLLQQLMKAVAPEGSENSADLDDLKNAEEMVRFQLRHGNDLLAMDSLRECDVRREILEPDTSLEITRNNVLVVLIYVII